jgi:hypothetical protein
MAHHAYDSALAALLVKSPAYALEGKHRMHWSRINPLAFVIGIIRCCNNFCIARSLVIFYGGYLARTNLFVNISRCIVTI